MIAFPEKVARLIQNHVTAEKYTLVRVDQMSASAAQIAALVRICNEPEIYAWLFRNLLNGKAYSAEQAQKWLDWSSEGWLKNTHFSFALIDAEGLIVAACDIKSAEPEGAELGYWSSAAHHGLMTNAVTGMCDEAKRAGFKSLTARVKTGNQRSKAVLKRCGFVPSLSSGKDECFTLQLMKQT